MIKLHVFSGFENRALGITSDMELGHLYDDEEDLAALRRAALKVGLKEQWLQSNETGIWHFDVWKKPLESATKLFPIVDDRVFAEDVRAARDKPRCGNCKFWEMIERDVLVGHHGTCLHPVGEAQHIAHTGEPAPYGLQVEGARAACELWKKKYH